MEEYRKSMGFLKRLCRADAQHHREALKEIKVHLARVVPEIEAWIRRRNFEPVQEALAQLREVDAVLDLTMLLGDYKYSYFICINSAYVVQQ